MKYLTTKQKEKLNIHRVFREFIARHTALGYTHKKGYKFCLHGYLISRPLARVLIKSNLYKFTLKDKKINITNKEV